MKLFKQLTDDADQMRERGLRRGEKVRARIAGEDRPSPWRAVLFGMLGALGGALATYLLDPQRGRTRRARYADQAAALARRVTNNAPHAVRQVGSTVAGKIKGLRASGNGQADLGDASLANKIETELFRDPEIPKGKININVEESVVVLRGEVDTAAQRRKLQKQAATIAGVNRVENLLHLPGERAPEEPPREHPDAVTAGA